VASAFRPTIAHRLWRQLPARQRRRIATWATALLAPGIDRSPPPATGGIGVAGEISRASGLGEAARLILRGLEHTGVPSWSVDVGRLLPAHSEDFAVASDQPPPGVPLILHVNAPLLPWVLLRLPRALTRGRRIIGYWLWELPTAPPEWRAGARFVHEVWVPSDFVANAVEPLLPGRVRIVPPPLAVARPERSALDRTAFGLPRDAVIVLVSFDLASSLERKNPLAAIAAFRAAFGARTDRILLIKVRNGEHAPDDFARIVHAMDAAPNMRLETRTFSTQDTHAMTAAADIVLSLHRSEGFGLVLAEAMLLNKPVIATGWSGNMSFMDRDSAALVGYRLMPARDPRRVYAGACWAEPDHATAVAHLRRLADTPEQRATLGASGAAKAAQRLDITPLTEALRGVGLERQDYPTSSSSAPHIFSSA
jgi:glycosyltransferase involved in cell wall biosynthesis